MEIEVLGTGDLNRLNELISVFAIVFETENSGRAGDNHLLSLLSKDTFFAIIASEENKIIGGLTAYVLNQYISEKPLAYIYDFAVKTEYQRKGVGKKLVEFTNDFFRKKGFEEVFVQADKIDKHAVDFYRSTKPDAEEDVFHYSYSL